MFLGDIDPRCETACQLWYTPACPIDAAEEFRSFHVIGSFLDPRALPEVRVRERRANPTKCYIPLDGLKRYEKH